MHRSRSKRRQLIRSTIVYSVMTTLVIVSLAVALLSVMGYRFDSEKKTLDQGGLIQVESRPSGAYIYFDGKRLPGSTPRQINATAGSHTVRITRDDYRPWQKTIAVEAGGVHWLNYTLLIPKDIVQTDVQTFPTVAASLPLPNNQMLVMESNRQPVFRLVELDKPADSTTIEMPGKLVPTEPGRYVIHKLSSNGRALLLEFRTAESSRWFVFDIKDASRTIDISSIVGRSQNWTDVEFATGSDRILYGLSAGEIRRVDTSRRTVSAPLAEGVAQYWQGSQGILTYVSVHDKKTKTRQLGYLTPDANKSRVIQTIYTGASTPLSIVAGEYHNRGYLAIQNSRTIDISRVNLRPSDSDGQIDMTSIAVINTEEEVGSLSFSPNNRFIVAQHDATYMTYDIEQDRFTSTTLRGDQKVTQPISWLDSYHVWSARDNQLRIYEFDGENVQSLGATVAGLTPQLGRNSEKLYTFRPTKDDEVQLVALSLRSK